MIVLEKLTTDTNVPGGLSLSGLQIGGAKVVWNIDSQTVRSLSFRNQMVVVQSRLIERFIIAYHTDEIYAVWVRGRFRFPTRIITPDLSFRASQQQQPAQNMELGYVFGSISRIEIVEALSAAGFVVDEYPWRDALHISK